jgi:molecular chaperone HtpG
VGFTVLWDRFLKGAVDSEDLPLSLSREKPQNSALLKRIRDVLTRKFLRFLSDEAKNNPESYREFYLEYHMFLKEGVCQDYAFMEQLSKLLLFDSSAAGAGQVISLDDYISRKCLCCLCWDCAWRGVSACWIVLYCGCCHDARFNEL